MEWRHGDIPVLDGAEVGIIFAGPDDGTSTDPEDLAIPRILHRLDGPGEDAASEPREPRPFDAIRRNGRQVHVEQRVLWKFGKRGEIREKGRDHLHLLLEVGEIRPQITAREGEG